MPTIQVTIVRDGDPPPWAAPESDPVLDTVIHLPGAAWKLAGLEGGMTSGAPSVALRFDTELGQVIAETSLAAWVAATCALRGAFPEAFAGTPLEGRD